MRYGYDEGGSRDPYRLDKALPWSPVTLAPEAMLILFVTVGIPEVEMAEGSSHYWEDIGVRYRVLGLPQERRVPLGFLLRVQA